MALPTRGTSFANRVRALFCPLLSYPDFTMKHAKRLPVVPALCALGGISALIAFGEDDAKEAKGSESLAGRFVDAHVHFHDTKKGDPVSSAPSSSNLVLG